MPSRVYSCILPQRVMEITPEHEKVSAIKKKKFNFFLFFYRVCSRQFLGEADFIALDEIFSCMLVCHTKGTTKGGTIGIGNRQLDGDGRAGLETHVERGEQNGTRRNKKSGAEDTRAIHNARTSVEMRPTDKFDGKWKNKKKRRWKSETIRRRDCIRHACASFVSRVFVSRLQNKYRNTEHCYNLTLLLEKKK